MNKIEHFSITVGTKNGSGSSTNTILRSIFKMGILFQAEPVSFQHQGLPTWYTIRVNRWIHCAQDTNDIVIAINFVHARPGICYAGRGAFSTLTIFASPSHTRHQLPDADQAIVKNVECAIRFSDLSAIWCMWASWLK